MFFLKDSLMTITILVIAIIVMVGTVDPIPKYKLARGTYLYFIFLL